MMISMVTISFNQAPYLSRAIDSVLSQRLPPGWNLEYIVVDPGSTDGSREIVASYGDALRPRFAPDDGPADGLNWGFRLASGSVMGYINADDFLLPGALASIAERFSCSDAPDVVLSGGWITTGDGSFRQHVTPTLFSARDYLLRRCVVFQQGTFFSRRAFDLAGGFNPHNKINWDAELLLEMSLAGASFVSLARDTAAFAIYPGTITSSASAKEMARVENARLFRRAYQRDPTSWETLQMRLGRIYKWARNPHTIADAVGGWWRHVQGPRQ